MKLDTVEHLLPDAIRVIVQIIGLPTTVKLVNSLGGTTFPVALRKSRMGEARYELLAEIIGADAADLITRHFGGDTLYIPLCRAALRELLYREIRADFDTLTREHSALFAVARLAVKYKMSDRHIWRLLKKQDDYGDAVTDQAALF